MNTATRAIAQGAWREQFNQGWRFSRIKLGLWLLLGQVGTASLFLWRLAPAPTMVPLRLPMLVVTLPVLFGAFVTGLLRGRGQLYGKTVLQVLHVSPTSGVNVLGALTLAGLPQRLVSSLAIATVVGLLVPAGALWWAIPLLLALTLVSSLIGYAAALFALVGWVRVEPRSLAIIWGIATGIGICMAYLLLFVMMWGGPVVALIPLFEVIAPWLIGIVSGLVVLPGLAMGLWVWRRPDRAGEWYREAFLRMQELSDGRRGMRTSRWPRILAGPAGALQAGQWRQIWLNWFTWARLAGTLLVFVTMAWKPGAMIRMAEQNPAAIVLSFGLVAVLGAFGELAGTVGGSDGPNIGLAMVAGLRARQVVTAKWVTSVPLALLAGAGTWVAGVLLKQPDLSLSIVGGWIGLGFGVIAVGGGLCDLDPHGEVTEREVPEILRAMLEQVPMKVGGIIGTVAAVTFTVAAVWLCQRFAAAALPLSIGFAVFAHLALVPGYLHLRRLSV